MQKENDILNSLSKKFPEIDISEAAVSVRKIYLSVPEEAFMNALKFLSAEFGFKNLCTVTGLDAGDGYEFIYHISDDEGVLMNLKFKTAGGDGVTIKSVLPIYQGATFYERELEGLLGVKVEGLPEGRQYPLPDNWPEGQYPMRKN
ncbi:MAG: NADH-quinone oxidoreductase subunit C [Oscillospiraceae bacterium]|nr:NADH-quinone oxidoreductase subunit C [Oscillospiraceae bacterium]